MSLEAGEQDSSIIGSGVFRNRDAGPLYAASSEALRKRSLISFLPLARCWPERRGTLPPGQTLLWIEALGQEARGILTPEERARITELQDLLIERFVEHRAATADGLEERVATLEAEIDNL